MADPDETVDPGGGDGAHASTIGIPDSGDPPASLGAEPLVSPDPRYRMTGEVGRGGLGRISRAWDHRLERPIAIKQLLRRQTAADARFLREALLTARLEHPAIVPVHDAGRDPDGAPYYAMKLVEGESLASVLGHATGLRDRLALLPHVIAVAEAMAYAHSRHIIHRDLKPQNVLLGAFGETVVIDWGLAKELGAPGASPTPEVRASTAGDLTLDGSVVGTPAYMAPEQARGEPVDERADVYALGAILYHVLAGAPPYLGRDADAVLDRLLAGPPEPLADRQPDVPRDLLAIVDKAMRRDPAARYPTAKQLADDLRRFQTGQIVGAHQYSAREILARWIRKHRTTVAVAGVLFVALTTLAIYSVREIASRRRHAEASRVRAEAEAAEARARSAEALREGARAALGRGDPLEARAKLRGSLELEDSTLARALWTTVSVDPLVWRRDLGAAVYDVAFSPDGQTIAAASQDHSIYLFDVATQATRVIRGQGDQITSIAFAPDGKSLASGTWSGEVGLWDLASGALRRLRGHTAGVWALAFSPDGTRVVSGSIDRTIRIWDVSTGVAEQVVSGHDAEVSRVVVSADGQTLLSTSTDRTARLWQFPSGTALRTLAGHELGVAGGDLSPDGRTAVTASWDRSIILWDVATGVARRTLRGHRDQVQSVQFSPDGRLLASSSADRMVWIWDVATGERRAELSGHLDRVTDVDFSPDGALVVSGGNDDGVRVWSVDHARNAPRGRGHALPVISVGFSPDSARVVSASYDQSVRTWDVATGAQLQVMVGHTQRLYSASFLTDGALIASASGDQSVRIWNADSGVQERRLEHGAAVYDVAVSPDGAHLVSVGTDHVGRIWDLTHERVVHELRGHTDRIYDATYSLDGAVIATGSYDTTVRLWDARTGAARQILRGHTDPVDGLGFLPGGRRLVSGSEDGTLRVWELATGAGRVLGTHPGRVYRLSIHPDGTRVGAADSSGTARIWDIETGAFVPLVGHRGEVDDLAFSPDGRWAATGSDDGTVRLWDAATGRPAWRAPVLLPESGELLTHLGWIALPSGEPARAAPAPPAWRGELEAHARAAARGDGDAVCILGDDGVVSLWSAARDERLAQTPAPDASITATADACVILSDRRARVLRATGEVALAPGVAVAWDRDEILVAGDRVVTVFGPDGARRGELPGGVDVTAVARVGDQLVLGFTNGNVELIPLDPDVPRPAFGFENAPAVPVVKLAAGPPGTVIVGYANGLLGLWLLDNGTSLHTVRMHGPIAHLARAGDELLVATELGDWATIDVGAFERGYCDLVREVWRSVPIGWEHGLVVRRAAPADHPCAP